MSTIDIRTDAPTLIDRIRFADKDSNYYTADSLDKHYAGGVSISDSDTVDDEKSLRVRDRQHAEYLIKALQKAIELGWL